MLRTGDGDVDWLRSANAESVANDAHVHPTVVELHRPDVERPVVAHAQSRRVQQRDSLLVPGFGRLWPAAGDAAESRQTANC